ncbi:AAA family ATPase [Staphylococcus agnetis]|uniref:AAA family ATPase n=1 Tax=Staphylococcus agnetis TaxID=985762 RepID=UPI00338F0C1D
MKIISVCAIKGGVGKTMIVYNMAKHLAYNKKKRFYCLILTINATCHKYLIMMNKLIQSEEYLLGKT